MGLKYIRDVLNLLTIERAKSAPDAYCQRSQLLFQPWPMSCVPRRSLPKRRLVLFRPESSSWGPELSFSGLIWNEMGSEMGSSLRLTLNDIFNFKMTMAGLLRIEHPNSRASYYESRQTLRANFLLSIAIVCNLRFNRPRQSAQSAAIRRKGANYKFCRPF